MECVFGFAYSKSKQNKFAYHLKSIKFFIQENKTKIMKFQTMVKEKSENEIND